MAQHIYFDESGFTGNNLLHPDQKYFVYASVASDDHEAKEVVESVIRRYGIQGGELKGRNLIRFNRGRRAVDEIISHFEGRVKLSVSDKKYALACKLFEYIFEPCLSEINSVFYRVGFHKFIANMLYIEFVARGAGAEDIFAEFEELMRTRDEAKLGSIFASSVHPENSPILVQIREFAQCMADDVRKELRAIGDAGLGKWILDLTDTALFTLLANWGTEYDQITAVCDPAKPLQHDQSAFDVMIGREDRVFSDAFGERHPITFNLSGPIQLRDSKISHGVQIADALAAAGAYVFTGATDAHATRWRSIIAGIGHYGSIIPDMDEVDIRDVRAQRNAVLLMELHSRAKAGKNLVEGMPEYIHIISRMITERRGHP
ncbi:DUF3800 domain-containing protein [Thioalkalivibrio sp. ALMg13-2]|uniref:DUF3800 domain-containing protein n=1 Tax=Thioalkalivibrio sp. ALMg13-2 TaxID=1158167 RepID=UPI00036E2889|nr:DUF3800 domain-containing protein [Thioalkalivibrio sp. ALMg13-2]